MGCRPTYPVYPVLPMRVDFVCVFGCELALTALTVVVAIWVPAGFASSMEPVAASAFPWTNAAATRASTIARMIIVLFMVFMFCVFVIFLLLFSVSARCQLLLIKSSGGDKMTKSSA